MPCFVGSDLGRHCLPFTPLERLQWVNDHASHHLNSIEGNIMHRKLFTKHDLNLTQCPFLAKECAQVLVIMV